MARDQSLLIDENVLKTLGAKTLKTLQTKGAKLEADILSKLENLEKMVMEGSSAKGMVLVDIDGNHQVRDISIDPAFSDWASDKDKLCKLMKEAINDAVYKVDLLIEKEISIIKKNYVEDAIKSTSRE